MSELYQILKTSPVGIKIHSNVKFLQRDPPCVLNCFFLGRSRQDGGERDEELHVTKVTRLI